MKNIKKFLTLLTIVLFVSCTTEVVKYIYIDPTTGEQISPDKLPNYGNNSDKPSQKPSDDPENPAEYIRTTSSTVTLPKCPENTKFDMIAIKFTDGRTEDTIVLGKTNIVVPVQQMLRFHTLQPSNRSKCQNTWSATILGITFISGLLKTDITL